MARIRLADALVYMFGLKSLDSTKLYKDVSKQSCPIFGPPCACTEQAA